MPRRTWRVASFLFFSGMCSLIYETVWIRELRLIFGASTSASAAVVACFIGGLGVGGLLLGKRADRQTRPLGLYASLEIVIALSAAATPLLLRGVRATYILLGGTRTLGTVGGACVRLVLSAIVFAIPTLAMGGTLPAASRAIEEPSDGGRRAVAVFYGVNTLGAVLGCMGATFVMFEFLGNRLTLWAACLVNLLVAVIARSVARAMPERIPEDTLGRARAESEPKENATSPLVLCAAAVTGFVFCLMELVWYRMLGPLLGGSVFTFGLILSVALVGIGLGGLLYAAIARRRSTMHAFAWVCLLEALFVAIPYACGDRLAVFAALLRPMGGLGFSTEVLGWALITAIVVFPPAVLTGAQFPLLISLLSKGEHRLGRDVGLAYACNTVGAIAGSLAGGFGLIPALTAEGCWRLVVWLLVGLGAAALLVDIVSSRRILRALAPVLLAVGAVVSLRAEGPTSAWRHSPIGAGRVDPAGLKTTNAIQAWLMKERRAIAWQVDGRESSVAISKESGVSFVVNGKNDGNARQDSATAVTLGLIGAILHPHPVRSMVIGLGTGSSVGWLADIPTMTDVDVAELEPAIVEVARRSAPVNRGALENPKVHLFFADAREALLTTKQRYDVIASEPSNPYRAGVASLFTHEYYVAVADDLEDGGILLQWVQGYEVDGQTMRTVYATLASVFPHVETWVAEASDLVLVASKRPIDHDADRLRSRIREEPFRSALAYTWRVTDLEGFLSHYVAGPKLAKRVAEQEAETNTDDQNTVEFGFARSVGSGAEFSVLAVRRAARELNLYRPEGSVGVDWEAVDEYSTVLAAAHSISVSSAFSPDLPRAHRMAAMAAAVEGNMPKAVKEWREQANEPLGPSQTAFLGVALADTGDEAAVPLIERMRIFEPIEGDLAEGRLLFRRGQPEDAWAALESAYRAYRTDPWPMPLLVSQSFDLVEQLIVRQPRLVPRIYAALQEPFVMQLCDEARMKLLVAAATHLPPGAPCVSAFAAYEPNPSWAEDFLISRADCYSAAGDPMAGPAAEDLSRFRSQRPPRFAAGL
jgi:spermidine synthase